MSIWRWNRLVVLAAFGCGILCPRESDGITIRDDRTEAEYIALSTDLRWAAAGAYTSTSTCSTSGGTLIHPEWTITAGHCLNASAEFVLGADRDNPDVQVPVLATERNPGYDGQDIGNGKDMGISQLAAPILDVTPVRLYRGSSERSNVATTIGYGRFGTGLTGDNQGGLNIRRAGQNIVDFYGQPIGATTKVMITDFDNPNDPSDSRYGDATPLDFEGGIAFYDSGSGWFMDFDGNTYLAGFTSFRYDPENPTANSSYGEVFGASRTSTEITWIESAHDLTQFWDQSDGNWNQDTSWLPGAQPGITNAAVIDGGRVTVTDVGEIAEYTFVVGTGTLRLENNFASTFLLVRNGGRLEVSGVDFGGPPTMAPRTHVGNVRMEAGGTLAVALLTDVHDQFNVSADAELAGTLAISSSEGGNYPYADPTTRGTVDEFVLLTAANMIGEFDDVTYDAETLIADTSNYVGLSNNGDDGMFRLFEYGDNEVIVKNYLAALGDANGDGEVDGADFLVWNNHKFTSGDWSSGDFTGDGTVDGADFLIWNNHKFTSVGLRSAVPEPLGLFSICLGAMVLSISRRR